MNADAPRFCCSQSHLLSGPTLTLTATAARAWVVVLCGLLLSVMLGGGMRHAEARELYVEARGLESWVDDSTSAFECGTRRNRACRSISRALSYAEDGDVILVGPGHYGDVNRDGVLDDSGDESASCGDLAIGSCLIRMDKAVKILSTHGAAVTIIDAAGITSSVIAVNAERAHFGAPGKGFTVIGGGAAGVVSSTTVNGVRIRGNRIFGFSRCVDITGGSDHRVTSNLIRDCTTGIRLGRTTAPVIDIANAIVKANIVTDAEYGIRAQGMGNEVVENVIVSSRSLGVEVGGVNFLFDDNIVNSTNGVGVNLLSTGGRNYVRRNLVTASTEAGVVVNYDPPDAQLAGDNRINNNNIYDNGRFTNCGVRLVSTDGLQAGAKLARNFWGRKSGPGANPADEVCVEDGSGTIINRASESANPVFNGFGSDRSRNADYHVQAYGRDSANCGRATNPCRSISKAIDRAFPGDSIYVGPGRYGDIDRDASLVQDSGDEYGPNTGCGQCLVHVYKGINVYSTHGAWATIIDVAGISDHDGVVVAGESARLGARYSGFTIRGARGDGRRVGVSSFNAVDSRVSGNVLVANDNGIKLNGRFMRASRNEVLANVNNGIVAEDRDLRVSRNMVSFNGENGVVVSRRRVRVSANVIAGHARTGVVAITRDKSIKNNWLVINTGPGVFAAEHSATIEDEISRNAFISNIGSGISFGLDQTSNASRYVVEENNFWGNNIAFWTASSGGYCGTYNDSLSRIVYRKTYWGRAAGPGNDPADGPCDNTDNPANITVNAQQSSVPNAVALPSVGPY